MGGSENRGRQDRFTAEINGKEVEVFVKFDETKSNLVGVPVATGDTVEKAAARAVRSEETDSNKLNIINQEEMSNLQKRRKPRVKKILDERCAKIHM